MTGRISASDWLLLRVSNRLAQILRIDKHPIDNANQNGLDSFQNPVTLGESLIIEMDINHFPRREHALLRI